MHRLAQINRFLEKWIYIILPLLMAIGIIGGSQVGGGGNLTGYLFMIITFVSSFSADWRRILDILKKPILFLLLTCLLHFILPFLTLKIGGELLEIESDLVIGMMLAMMLPIGVTSIFWVVFTGGNVTTALTFVTLNTLISPFVLSLTFYLFMDETIEVGVSSLMLSLFKLVLIPSILGMLVGEWLRKQDPKPKFNASTALASKCCLYIVVFLNASALSDQLTLIRGNFFLMFIAVMCFMILGYLTSYGLSFLFEKEVDKRIAVVFVGGMRNYTVGLVIASNFFTPLVSFPILIAMLIQHPLAMIGSKLFQKKNN